MNRVADELTSLRELFTADQLIMDPVELITYEIDAGVDRGHPGAVLFAADTKDVVRAVAWCRDHGVPLVARGSGTGLSGGAVSIAGGLVLEFSRMKQIEEIDETSLRARFQPGVIAQYFADTVAARGLHYPPDPASARSASLGGTVAENAGGPHCLKYGVTANYVMGMEIVLPDAQRLTLGGPAVDYPGVDLAALLTGNEGSLAMITETTVRLLAKPPAVMTMMAAFDSVDLACSAVSAIIADGIVPATLELMDRKMMEILEDYTHAGLPVEAGAALIIEVDGYPAGLKPQIDRITSIIERFKAFGLRCTQDEEERAAIWLARKSVAGALARLAPASLAVDPTVPRSRLGEALRRMAKICEERKVPTYYVSHAGDGNLHPQILIADANDGKLMDHILETGRLIMQEAVRLGGTISGEHGVGVEKRELMNFIYRPDELAAMREIKAVFDPENRFNPGKLFPTTAPEPDLIPPLRILPAVQAIADQIRAAAGSSPAGRVAIVGNAPPDGVSPAAEICVSSQALDGVLSFVADDMYVVAGAGTPLKSLAGFLETKNRILPLVSPWEETTLGGLVAANLNGPLRARYGGIKDLLLSMEVILPDGRLIEAGRPLVKNVAGYDLPRLFVGSFGSLGMITSVTFKVLAPPKARLTCSIPVADPAVALRVGLALYRQAITTSAILWIRENGASQGKLICTFEGQPEEVEIEKELLAGLAAASRLAPVAPVAGDDGSSLWAAWVRSACQNGPLTKYGVAPGDLPALLSSLAGKAASGAALIDIANGCLYLADDGDACLAAPALERGGYAMDISQSPPDPKRIFKDPSGAQLLSALKRRWDPSGSFNPRGPLF